MLGFMGETYTFNQSVLDVKAAALLRAIRWTAAEVLFLALALVLSTTG